MNIAEAVVWAKEKLKDLEHPKLEAEVLLSTVLGKERIFLKAFTEKELNKDDLFLYKKIVQERSDRIPIAQILGYKVWHDLKILVNKHVLIPRDETEVLCLEIQKYLCSQKQTALNVLDIGTGSGCISIFLKKHFPKIQVCGVDVSLEALKIAEKNKQLQTLEIDFRYSDLFSTFEKRSQFDVIVANLPYVPETECVSIEVQKEPSGAIFSGNDGLDLMCRLSNELQAKKIVFKALFLEFLPFQEEAIAQIFNKWNVEFLTDEGGSVFFARVDGKNKKRK